MNDNKQVLTLFKLEILPQNKQGFSCFLTSLGHKPVLNETTSQ